MESFELDMKKVLMRKYKLRRAGGKYSTFEITIPREIVEREMRRLELTEEEALKTLLCVWKYNNFHGVYLSFERKKKEDKTSNE